MFNYLTHIFKFFPRVILLLFALITPGLVSGQAAKDSTRKYVLDLKGRIMFDTKHLAGAQIDVYIDTFTLYRTVVSDEKGWCPIVELPLQRYYVLKISKKGFVSKIFTADTHVPKQYIQDYLFEFTAVLFVQLKELTLSMLKYPVAKITFNTYTKKFDYDYNYTAKVNNDIRAMYQDYYMMKEKGRPFPPEGKDSAAFSVPRKKPAKVVRKDSLKVKPAVIK